VINSPSYECVIVGAGPAGLNAALILGRCRRRVLLCDNDRPRNGVTRAMHGFLTRDGVAPHEFRRVGREQLCQYDTVEFVQATVSDACTGDDGFEVTLDGQRKIACRKLLLATGVADRLPEIEGLAQFYGRSVYHCPYCDGWEFRDQPLAVYGNGKSGAGLSLTVSIWSKDLVLCTDGPAEIARRDEARLEARGIVVRSDKILRLEGQDGMLRRIVFAQGEALARAAMFIHTDQRQQCELALRLGCNVNQRRAAEGTQYEGTNVPGLYLAGDTSRDVQFAIVAAAEGARAAFAINKVLLAEELHHAGQGRRRRGTGQ
jgi:thioredoxin reductase